MTRINLSGQQQQIDGNTTDSNIDSNTDSDHSVDLDGHYRLRHNLIRNSYSSNSNEVATGPSIDCTEALAKIKQLGHDAKVRLERVREQRTKQQNFGSEHNSSNSQNQPQAQVTSQVNKNFKYGDEDLRPKFAILKHKAEVLHPSTAAHLNVGTNRPQAETPSWFFNIPTTRSPFPYFESKLPAEDTI